MTTGLEGPQPKGRRGRRELEKALRQQADLGLRAELEQVIALGDKVILVMRTPGVDQYRHWRADDRTYDVVTVREGMIVRLHACRDRGEARSLAGIA
jgi:ketosteroid isomerase-like protein